VCDFVQGGFDMQINLQINIGRPRWARDWSTRRKVIVFLALALVLPPAAFVAASDIFGDVPNDHIFHDNISAISGARITTGTSPTTFSPEALSTRGQIAAFLHRGLPRIAYDSSSDLALTNEHQDSAVVTINTGGTPGGTGFVKLDASLSAVAGSGPCELIFYIAHSSFRDAHRSGVVDLGGGRTDRQYADVPPKGTKNSLRTRC
jgi:hypothetical protein